MRPLPVLLAVLALAALLGLSRSAAAGLAANRARILDVLTDAAAVACVLAAAAILAACSRALARTTGSHTEITAADEPEPVRGPAWPAVAGYHPAYRLRPVPAEMAEDAEDTRVEDVIEL